MADRNERHFQEFYTPRRQRADKENRQWKEKKLYQHHGQQQPYKEKEDDEEQEQKIVDHHFRQFPPSTTPKKRLEKDDDDEEGWKYSSCLSSTSSKSSYRSVTESQRRVHVHHPTETTVNTTTITTTGPQPNDDSFVVDHCQLHPILPKTEFAFLSPPTSSTRTSVTWASSRKTSWTCPPGSSKLLRKLHQQRMQRHEQDGLIIDTAMKNTHQQHQWVSPSAAVGSLLRPVRKNRLLDTGAKRIPVLSPSKRTTSTTTSSPPPYSNQYNLSRRDTYFHSSLVKDSTKTTYTTGRSQQQQQVERTGFDGTKQTPSIQLLQSTHESRNQRYYETLTTTPSPTIGTPATRKIVSSTTTLASQSTTSQSTSMDLHIPSLSSFQTDTLTPYRTPSRSSIVRSTQTTPKSSTATPMSVAGSTTSSRGSLQSLWDALLPDGTSFSSTTPPRPSIDSATVRSKNPMASIFAAMSSPMSNTTKLSSSLELGEEEDDNHNNDSATNNNRWSRSTSPAKFMTVESQQQPQLPHEDDNSNDNIMILARPVPQRFD
ncbi:hypothetical protein IV203_025065 [Nitzschia inconspicua]|uniref:Uncharacterized protein n=1 Tax=Nitzschia inconspicua TaxID=303405 RepID=A0A9K3PAB4_9STRA|nr:hypothetical protein IV203_025188 [Nitzschia inconspicua]KAG7365624.1 hypothetical protein IV203_025065 [Nitzschia inconspicua]